MNIKIKNEFKLTYDSGDPWGSCMAWLFATCDYLTFETDENIPDNWHFKPSPFGADTEDYYFQALKELNIPSKDVLHFGSLLIRFSELLKRKQLDY